jgi:hypothetical protein
MNPIDIADRAVKLFKWLNNEFLAKELVWALVV